MFTLCLLTVGDIEGDQHLDWLEQTAQQRQASINGFAFHHRVRNFAEGLEVCKLNVARHLLLRYVRAVVTLRVRYL